MDAPGSARARAFASTLFYGVLERQITLRLHCGCLTCQQAGAEARSPQVLQHFAHTGLYQLLDILDTRAGVGRR